MTRSIVLAFALALLVAGCCHTPDRPSYCSRPFDMKDPAFDLDGSGTVTIADFAVYQKNCARD